MVGLEAAYQTLMQVYFVLLDNTLQDQAVHIVQGIYSRGKSGRSVLFTWVRECQGKSGKPAMVRGKSPFVL